MCNTNNYDSSIIAEKIKKECMRQNITVKTMLQELNVNKDTIYKMDKGGAPSYITIARICDYLCISVDSLLDRAAPTNADNAPPSVSVGQAVQTIADYMHTSPDYVRGALRLPPDDKDSAL